jgi:hypothetical protein
MSPIGRMVPRPVVGEVPFRHLIAQYTHKVQTVVCTCGFVGSSMQGDTRTPSEWDRHIRANRSTPA